MSRVKFADLKTRLNLDDRTKFKKQPKKIERITEPSSTTSKHENTENTESDETELIPQSEELKNNIRDFSSSRGTGIYKPRKIDEENLNKNTIIKLIKFAGINTASIELIETLRIVIGDLSKYMIEKISANLQVGSDGKILITSEKIQKHVNYFFKTDSHELDQELVLNSQGFEKLIRPFLDDKNCSIKRDVLYYLQTFIEVIVCKLLQSAEIVSASSNRLRIGSKDLLAVYTMYTL